MENDQPEIHDEDLRHALREMGTYVDVTEDDLRRIYTIALEHARRRLRDTILVRDVMTTEVVTVTPEDDAHEAARRLSEHRVSGLPVVDTEGRVVGLVSEADILSMTGLPRDHAFRRLLRHLLGEPVPARVHGHRVVDVMATPAITTTADVDIVEVAGILDHRGIKRLPVVDSDGRLVGIVSRADIVRAMVGR